MAAVVCFQTKAWQLGTRRQSLQHHCFGGKVEVQTWGTATSAPAVNLLRIEEKLSEAHLRLAGTFVENLHWRQCIERYDREHTFFYLDPPYWQTAGYGVSFDFAEYVAIAEVMRRLKGKAMMSINDHPDIREVFKSFHLETVDISYQVGGGHHSADRTELVVWSWDPSDEPAGLF